MRAISNFSISKPITQWVGKLWQWGRWFALDSVATLKIFWAHRLWLIIAAFLSLLASYYIGINSSRSMAAKVVFIERGAVPKLNDPIVYTFGGKGLSGGTYFTGARFFKRVAGFHGSVITVDGRTVSVDGRVIGEAKRMGQHGDLLSVIAAGVVPPGYLFVTGETPDSFDSRYAESGLVRVDSVIGVAHVLF